MYIVKKVWRSDLEPKKLNKNYREYLKSNFKENLVLSIDK